MSKAADIPSETTLFVRDTCLCLHLQRAARALARRFDDALRPLGLTSGQFSMMMALNRPEPPSIGSVASLLSMDRTTLTAALKPLQRRDLVTVMVDAADRRGRRLRLTPAGRALLARAATGLAAHACRDRPPAAARRRGSFAAGPAGAELTDAAMARCDPQRPVPARLNRGRNTYIAKESPSTRFAPCRSSQVRNCCGTGSRGQRSAIRPSRGSSPPTTGAPSPIASCMKRRGRIAAFLHSRGIGPTTGWRCLPTTRSSICSAISASWPMARPSAPFTSR